MDWKWNKWIHHIQGGDSGKSPGGRRSKPTKGGDTGKGREGSSEMVGRSSGDLLSLDPLPLPLTTSWVALWIPSAWDLLSKLSLKLRGLAKYVIEKGNTRCIETIVKHECLWDQRKRGSAWTRGVMVGLKEGRRIQKEFRRNIAIHDSLDMVGEWCPNEFHVWVWTDNSYFSFQKLWQKINEKQSV